MTIPIWDKRTGEVWVSDFDMGVATQLNVMHDNSNPQKPCLFSNIAGTSEPTGKVSVYFNQPEQIYIDKKFPYISINRDSMEPALHRWMGVGQLEYRAGVSGTEITIGGRAGYTQYVSKPQAMPYDFTYTITVADRYERNAQNILKQVLKRFPPVGKLFVTDSLGLVRSYEAHSEGSLTPVKDIVDAVNRSVSYVVTVRVDGEIDLTDPTITGAVTGFGLQMFPLK